MRIIFFGSPAAALPFLERLLEAGHKIEFVITQPDKPSGRGKAPTAPPVKVFALKRGIPVLQPAKIRQDEKVLETIKKSDPDINIVVAYGQIIPASIIYLPRFKSINVHFSLLPKYRGAAPVQWAILSGEKKTGVTIFELNEKWTKEISWPARKQASSSGRTPGSWKPGLLISERHDFSISSQESRTSGPSPRIMLKHPTPPG